MNSYKIYTKLDKEKKLSRILNKKLNNKNRKILDFSSSNVNRKNKKMTLEKFNQEATFYKAVGNH